MLSELIKVVQGKNYVSWALWQRLWELVWGQYDVGSPSRCSCQFCGAAEARPQNTVWHLISPVMPTVSKYFISTSLSPTPSPSPCLFLTFHHSSWSVFIKVHCDFKAMKSAVNFDTTELTHGCVWSLCIRKAPWHPSESEKQWAPPCWLSPWKHKSFWLTSTYT